MLTIINNDDDNSIIMSLTLFHIILVTTVEDFESTTLKLALCFLVLLFLCAPQKTYHNRCVFNGLDCVTWPQPKSAPFGGACPSQHHVAVGRWVNSRYQRSRSRALGKGPPQPSWPARCG